MALKKGVFARESNRLIFPVQCRFGFNSGFKFGSVPVKVQIN